VTEGGPPLTTRGSLAIVGAFASFVALAGRLAFALAVAATVAAVIVWSGSPRLGRLAATVRSGTRR